MLRCCLAYPNLYLPRFFASQKEMSLAQVLPGQALPVARTLLSDLPSIKRVASDQGAAWPVSTCWSMLFPCLPEFSDTLVRGLIRRIALRI